MKIENPDAFKKWLVNILNPIFEGDPEKLALYIVALAKKVENDQPSRERCINDLDVFLESNTNSFVDTLFDALFNKTYLTADNSDQSKQTEIPTNEDLSKKRDIDRRRQSDLGGVRNQQLRGRLSRDYQEIDLSSSNRSNRTSSHGRRRKRSRNRTHGLSRSSSSESSSPSPVRRSRSRSPYSRSRSPNNLDSEPKKQRCKDFDEKGICTAAELCPYDHGEVVVVPSTGSNGGSGTNNQIPINLPYQQQYNVQNNNLPRQQFNQKRRIQMNKNQTMPQNRYMNKQQHQQRNVMQQGQNDNMYNQQQKQQQQQQIRQVITNRPRNLVSIVTSIHEEDQIDVNQQRGVKRTHNSNMIQNNQQNDTNNNLNNQIVYDVNNEQFNTTNNNNNNINQQAQQTIPHNQQALLPTPGVSYPQNIQQQQQQQQGQNVQNTTLILRKIPAQLNTFEKMQEHFSKFGQIIDIQCHYDQLNDAALVKFSTNKEAFAAYKSPQPVFNNRFIRLYWLSSYLKQQQQQQPNQPSQHQVQTSSDEPSVKRPAKERLSFTKTDTTQSDTSLNKSHNDSLNKENLIKPTTSSSSLSLSQTTTKKVKETLSYEINKGADEISKKIASTSQDALAKQMQDENKKKALLLKQEVQKKARELIEQQIKDQKLLLKKFEQAKTVEEKNQILSLIKKLNEAIEKENEILNDKKIVPPSIPTIVKSPSGNLIAEQDKAEAVTTVPSSPSILTAQSPFSFQKTPKSSFVIPPVHHLKLNNKRLNTTNFLKTGKNIHPSNAAKFNITAATAMSTGVVPNLYSFSRVSVDNRPKQLLITGVENFQEKTNIINFINAIGCHIENLSEQTNDNNQLSLSINFATRRDAEIALAKCTASLTSKKISINWHKSIDNSNQQKQNEPDSQDTKEDSNKQEDLKVNEQDVKQEENEKKNEASETTKINNNNHENNNQTTEETNTSVNDSLTNFLSNEPETTNSNGQGENVAHYENDENSDVFDNL